MKKIPERFKCAIEILQIQPDDQVLEIGCGNGILAELIAGKLKDGRLLAIDKSAVMFNKAKERVKGGIVAFINTEFQHIDTTSRFNKIIAFNVNIFKKGTDKEFCILHKLLASNGLIYIFYQQPIDYSERDYFNIIENLKKFSFQIFKKHHLNTKPFAFCVVAGIM